MRWISSGKGCVFVSHEDQASNTSSFQSPPAIPTARLSPFPLVRSTGTRQPSELPDSSANIPSTGHTNSNTIILGHINICSMRNKIHEIHDILYKQDIHILSVNETWLDSSIPDSSLSIPGYNIYRNDRSTHGGGVCFYVLSSYKVNVLHSSMPGDDHSIETLFLRVVLPVRPRPIKITVCSAYRPPNSRVTHWDMFSNSIDSVLTHGLKLIILGDLNIDVLRQQPTSQGRYLEEMCSEFCLTNVVSQPTRIPSNTCLDLALVSSGLLPTSATVVPLDGISDHSLVLLPLSFLGLQLSPRTQCRTI